MLHLHRAVIVISGTEDGVHVSSDASEPPTQHLSTRRSSHNRQTGHEKTRR